MRRSSLLFLVFLLFAATALAQDGQNALDARAAEIQAKVEALQTADVPNRADLESLYAQALLQLERAGALQQRSQDYARQIEEAPDLLQSLRDELASPPDRADPEPDPEASLRELELRLQEAEASRAAAQRTVDELAAEVAHRAERLAALPDEIEAARATTGERESALRALAGAEPETEARRTNLEAELDALGFEEAALLGERSAYEARRELLPLRRDQAQRALSRAEQVTLFWQTHVNERRQEEADAAAREAERQARQTAALFPSLNKIAERNGELASLRQGDEGVPARIARAEAELLATQQLRDETARRFQATKRKIAVAGLSEGMGQLLRREFRWTASPRALRGESEQRREELSRTQLQQITLQEEREAVGDIATRHEALMESLGPVETDPERLSQLARQLLDTQRSLHDALIRELGSLIGTLLEQQRMHDELLATTLAYRAEIEERILWVPSVSVLPSASDAAAELAWFVAPESWSAGFQRSFSVPRAWGGRSILLVATALACLLYRGRIRRAILRTTDEVRSYRTDRYSLTTRAVLLTGALALPLPLLCWWTGWLLLSPPDQLDVARCAGLALQQIAATLFVLGFLRQSVQPKHLSEGHFRWPVASTGALRTELRWFVAVAIPLEFLAVAYNKQGSVQSGESLEALRNDPIGRLAFAGLAAALALVIFRLFRPRTNVLAELYRRQTSILERTHRLWSGLLFAVPIALGVLSLAGFHYSALEFATRLRDSLGLGLLLVFVNCLLLRWLFIARRRLAVEQARQRVQAKVQAEDAESQATESGTTSLDEESVDIPAVDAQTRELIRSGVLAATLLGLFVIWAGAFPALRALDRVQLWPELAVLESEGPAVEAAALETPANASASETVLDPSAGTGALLDNSAARPDPAAAGPVSISLADLILAALILALTAAATKNAPGVLEIGLLQRLPLDSGSRYALSTLFRYVILIGGLTAGFGAIGIGWDKIQWLAAALTFGLAFGLQEIFANFVSGIIILLERPVRVGDIVTVGTTEGRVTKLRMRSTTILDWDRREMLVPNKEFITGSVVNWTLSDPVTRVVVQVGIAYGSDTAKARSLLVEVAEKNPLILDDPAPRAIYRNFGESTLDFELRVFMANRDLWPEVIDQLHTQIDNAFRQAKIEISFPQRDLHIRTAEGLKQDLAELDAGELRGRG